MEKVFARDWFSSRLSVCSSPHLAKPFPVICNCKPTLCKEMNIIDLDKYFVTIPDGEIELRDDRIKQKWKTKIQSFSISKFPVTQKIYTEVVNENPSEFIGENLPVENVSWIDAVNFCNKLSEIYNLENCYIFSETDVVFDRTKKGFRLPTEAEWVFSCKAGNNAIRYGELEEIAWYKNNSDKKTHEVGLKKPNNWGIYDMLGNFWEWCSDVYDETVYGTYRIFCGYC